MANPWARDRATLFYLGFGLFGLLVVALGFGVTYIVPMARRSFSAPWFVHLHGASALGWLLLVIVQAQLVRGRRTPLHRRLGQIALPLAVLVWASGFATAGWVAERDLPKGVTAAMAGIAGTFTGLTLFLLLAMAAFVTRRRPDWHKRLVLLATIHLLWPAFFRLRHLLPAIPNPDIWLALVVPYFAIVVAAARDQWRYGKIHPVWLFIGPALVVEQTFEFIVFERGLLSPLGEWLYPLIT